MTDRRRVRHRHQPAEPTDRTPEPHGGGAEQRREADTSRVGVTGALRARDVDRPTQDDLDRAERELTIVRTHWKP